MNVREIHKEIVEHLEAIQYEIKEAPESDDYIDVRLRLQADGSFTVLYGDPSYDTDHRGFWGSSSIAVDTDLEALAHDLLDQALDDQSQSES